MANIQNFVNFSSVKIGANPVNTFAGMMIYNAALSVNPGTPTKLVIRCVSAQIGQQVVVPQVFFPPAVGFTIPNVSTITTRVWIGPLYIPEMYLLSKETHTAAGQKTMTITFIDKSILLDKIFVGLIGTHSSNNDLPLAARLDGVDPAIGAADFAELFAVNNLGQPAGWNRGVAAPVAPPNDPAPPAGMPIRTRALKVPITLHCEPCHDEIVAASWAGVKPSLRRINKSYLAMIDYGRIVDVNHFYGGKIILGVDQFTSKRGDLAETNYNFTDLLTAMAEAGLLPLDMTPNKSIWRMLGWVDKNPYHRVKTVGTLKSVLDTFAGEFGFFYYWDFSVSSFSRMALRAADLTVAPMQPTAAMVSMQSIVYDPPDGVGFDNINTSETMEGTKSVQYQAYYRKPAKPKNWQKRLQYRQIYQAIDPHELFGSAFNGGRNDEEFAISCALAKFSKNARSVYNFYYATPPGLIWNGVAWVPRNLEHLGLTYISQLSGPEVSDLIDDDFSVTAFNDTIRRYGPEAIGYLMVYSRMQEGRWEAWESKVADIYGKYYLHEEETSYDNQCGLLEKWERDITHLPQGKQLLAGEVTTLPFVNLLKSHPQGKAVTSRITANFANITNHDNKFMLFARNNPWGTDQSAFESAFVHSGVDFMEQLVPTYITLAGTIKNRFFDRVKDVMPGAQAQAIVNQVEARDNDAEVVLVLVADKNFVVGNAGAVPPQKQRWWIDTYLEPPYRTDAVINPTNWFLGAPDAWNNPNEYTRPDPRFGIAKCDKTFYEIDYVRELCECPSKYGRVPSGAGWANLVPGETELADEALTANLCPRGNEDLAPKTWPWKDWGQRYYASYAPGLMWPVLPLNQAQINSAYYSDQTPIRPEDYVRPFMRDWAQEECKALYNTNNWFLADAQKSWDSKVQIHHARGFRIHSWAPGVSGKHIGRPAAPNVMCNGVVVPGNTICGEPYQYHPTGSGFIGPATSVDVIFPSENWYLGVRNDVVNYTKTLPGAKQVRGTIGNAGQGMEIQLNNQDITSDYDTLIDPAENSIIEVSVPSDPFGNPGNLGWNLDHLTIDEWWARVAPYQTNLSVFNPQKSLSFRQFGTSAVLAGFINPMYGLQSFSVTLDQDGSYLDYAFADRPRTLPQPDALKIQIAPQLNMNIIR